MNQLDLAFRSGSNVRVRYRYHRPTRVVTGLVVGISLGYLTVRMDDGSILRRREASFATLN